MKRKKEIKIEKRKIWRVGLLFGIFVLLAGIFIINSALGQTGTSSDFDNDGDIDYNDYLNFAQCVGSGVIDDGYGCVDPDGNNGIYTKSTTYVKYGESDEDYCSQVRNRDGSYIDYVHEQWCDQGVIMETRIKCDNGCVDGACVASSGGAQCTIRTYRDRDPFIGQDPNNPEWIWELGNLDQVGPTQIVDSDADPQGPFIGISNVISNSLQIGECLDFPDDYASACLHGLSVPSSDYAPVSIGKSLVQGNLRPGNIQSRTTILVSSSDIAGAGGVCDIPDRCTSDSQCNFNEVCSYDGYCGECYWHNDCAFNQVCSRGICFDGCLNDATQCSLMGQGWECVQCQCQDNGGTSQCGNGIIDGMEICDKGLNGNGFSINKNFATGLYEPSENPNDDVFSQGLTCSDFPNAGPAESTFGLNSALGCGMNCDYIYSYCNYNKNGPVDASINPGCYDSTIGRGELCDLNLDRRQSADDVFIQRLDECSDANPKLREPAGGIGLLCDCFSIESNCERVDELSPTFCENEIFDRGGICGFQTAYWSNGIDSSDVNPLIVSSEGKSVILSMTKYGSCTGVDLNVRMFDNFGQIVTPFGTNGRVQMKVGPKEELIRWTIPSGILSQYSNLYHFTVDSSCNGQTVGSGNLLVLPEERELIEIKDKSNGEIFVIDDAGWDINQGYNGQRTSAILLETKIVGSILKADIYGEILGVLQYLGEVSVPDSTQQPVSIFHVEHLQTTGNNAVIKLVRDSGSNNIIDLLIETKGDTPELLTQEIISMKFLFDSLNGKIAGLGNQPQIPEAAEIEISGAEVANQGRVQKGTTSGVMTTYGIKIGNQATNSFQDRVLIDIPGDQVLANVLLTLNGAQTQHQLPVGKPLSDNLFGFGLSIAGFSEFLSFNGISDSASEELIFGKISPEVGTGVTLPLAIVGAIVDVQPISTDLYYAFNGAFDLRQTSAQNPLKIHYLGKDMEIVGVTQDSVDIRSCSLCGDSLIEGIEDCDDGRQCGDGSDCTLNGVCTDGSQCGARGGDGCSSQCFVEQSLCVSSVRSMLKFDDDSVVQKGIQGNLVRGTSVDNQGIPGAGMDSMSVSYAAADNTSSYLTKSQTYTDRVFEKGSASLHFTFSPPWYFGSDSIQVYGDGQSSEMSFDSIVFDTPYQAILYASPRKDENQKIIGADLARNYDPIHVYEGERAWEEELILLSSLKNEQGWLFEVERVADIDSGFNSDIVEFRDVLTGNVYSATISSQGVGSLVIGAETYSLAYGKDAGVGDGSLSWDVTLDGQIYTIKIESASSTSAIVRVSDSTTTMARNIALGTTEAVNGLRIRVIQSSFDSLTQSFSAQLLVEGSVLINLGNLGFAQSGWVEAHDAQPEMRLFPILTSERGAKVAFLSETRVDKNIIYQVPGRFVVDDYLQGTSFIYNAGASTSTFVGKIDYGVRWSSGNVGLLDRVYVYGQPCIFDSAHGPAVLILEPPVFGEEEGNAICVPSVYTLSGLTPTPVFSSGGEALASSSSNRYYYKQITSFGSSVTLTNYSWASNVNINVPLKQQYGRLTVEGGEQSEFFSFLVPFHREKSPLETVYLDNTFGNSVRKVFISGVEYTLTLVSASDTTATIEVRSQTGLIDTRIVHEGQSDIISGLIVQVEDADEDTTGGIIRAVLNVGVSGSIIIGERELPYLLASGVVRDSSGNNSYNYGQSITFKSYGSYDMTYKSPVFGMEPETILEISTDPVGEPFYTYKTAFTPALPLSTSAFDYGTLLTLLDSDYSIGADSDDDILVLNGAVKISLDTNKDFVRQILVDSVDLYEIELVSASDTSATIKMTDNIGRSEVRDIPENGAKVFSGGIEVYLLEADETATSLSAVLLLHSCVSIEAQICRDYDGGNNYAAFSVSFKGGRGEVLQEGVYQGYSLQVISDDEAILTMNGVTQTVWLGSFTLFDPIDWNYNVYVSGIKFIGAGNSGNEVILIREGWASDICSYDTNSQWVADNTLLNEKSCFGVAPGATLYQCPYGCTGNACTGSLLGVIYDNLPGNQFDNSMNVYKEVDIKSDGNEFPIFMCYQTALDACKGIYPGSVYVHESGDTGPYLPWWNCANAGVAVIDRGESYSNYCYGGPNSQACQFGQIGSEIKLSGAKTFDLIVGGSSPKSSHKFLYNGEEHTFELLDVITGSSASVKVTSVSVTSPAIVDIVLLQQGVWQNVHGIDVFLDRSYHNTNDGSKKAVIWIERSRTLGDVYDTKILWKEYNHLSNQEKIVLHELGLDGLYKSFDDIHYEFDVSGYVDVGELVFYDDLIVWLGPVGPSYEVFYYDNGVNGLFENGNDDLGPTQLTNTGSDKNHLSIYDDSIVWADKRNGNWDIYLYDFSTNTEVPFVINQQSQWNPDIYDTKVVWQDGRDGNWEIYMRDIVSGQEDRITNNPQGQENPSIDGNVIVWEDWRNLKYLPEIFLYGLGANGLFENNGGDDSGMYGGLSFGVEPEISGTYIVWQEYGRILLYYLGADGIAGTSDDSRVLEVDKGYPNFNSNIGVQGSRIVWNSWDAEFSGNLHVMELCSAGILSLGGISSLNSGDSSNSNLGSGSSSEGLVGSSESLASGPGSEVFKSTSKGNRGRVSASVQDEEQNKLVTIILTVIFISIGVVLIIVASWILARRRNEEKV
ncbi:MAG: hypothetical protein AABX73_01595 [Nanoarchaeota archaeon]